MDNSNLAIDQWLWRNTNALNPKKKIEFSLKLCGKERTPIDRFDSADAMASNQFKGKNSVAIRSKIKKPFWYAGYSI